MVESEGLPSMCLFSGCEYGNREKTHIETSPQQTDRKSGISCSLLKRLEADDQPADQQAERKQVRPNQREFRGRAFLIICPLGVTSNGRSL